MTIFGLPGVYLSNKILETAFTVSGIHTNLMIDQDMDLRQLTRQLKDHVTYLHWVVKDSVKQQVAPFNAILDLLGSKSNGAFRLLEVPKNLLLKSSWLERLGGRAKIESSYEDLITIAHTETGLEIEDDLDDEDEDVSEVDEEEDEEDYEDEDESMELEVSPGTQPRPPSTAAAPIPWSSKPWKRDILR